MSVRDGALLRFTATGGSPHVAVYTSLIAAQRDVAEIESAQKDRMPIVIYGVLIADGSPISVVACKNVYLDQDGEHA